MSLPRILYAVPRTLQVRMAIAKAIRMLAEQDEAEQLRKRAEVETPTSVREIAEEVAREVCRELRKAGFNPNEPRVPAGNPDGGEWITEGGSNSPTDQRAASDTTPDNNLVPGTQYAANDPPGIDHSQSPPPEEPPEIPPRSRGRRGQSTYSLERPLIGWKKPLWRENRLGTSSWR